LKELTENEEKALLQEMAAGSEKAFSRLYHLYNDKLYSFIFRTSGSSQLAEDIVQEVFLKIWQRRSEAIAIVHFDAYLFRTARNQALNAFKRMAKETIIITEMGKDNIDPVEIDAALELKEMELSVRQAIDKLSTKQKQVFVLSREHGLKQADISRILHITVPTVKSHITQAMHFIRKECKNIYPMIKLLVIVLSSFLS
jgi:RNA polymerase sigma-70 factor (family 1)